MADSSSDLNDVDELFDGPGRLLQRRSFVARKFELDDLFHAAGPEFHRNADEEIVQPVFALLPWSRASPALIFKMASTIAAAEAPGAYQALVPTSFVISRRRWRAVADRLDAVWRQQLGDGHASDRRESRQRDHRVAMATEHEARDVGRGQAPPRETASWLNRARRPFR